LEILTTILIIGISYFVARHLTMYFGMKELRNTFRVCRICKEKKCVLEFTETKSDICNQCFNQIVENKSRENITPPQL
jgi:hypothetical protein